MKYSITLVLVLVILQVQAQLPFSLQSQSPTLVLHPEQEQPFQKVKAKYALEISEIAHSEDNTETMNRAMRDAWRRRTAEIQSILDESQFKIFLAQESKPVFYRSPVFEGELGADEPAPAQETLR